MQLMSFGYPKAKPRDNLKRVR